MIVTNKLFVSTQGVSNRLVALKNKKYHFTITITITAVKMCAKKAFQHQAGTAMKCLSVNFLVMVC